MPLPISIISAFIFTAKHSAHSIEKTFPRNMYVSKLTNYSTSVEIVKLSKRVSVTTNGAGYLVSLPTRWLKDYSHPREVSMFLGNLLIICSPEDDEVAQEAIRVLVDKGLLKPLSPKKNTMERIQGGHKGLELVEV